MSKPEEAVAVNLRPLQYNLKPELVEIRQDVLAGTRSDGSPLTVDLYLPATRTAQKLPIALLLHGGLPDFIPIRPTQWRMFRDWGIALAQSGAGAVMFNHSLGWPEHRVNETMIEIEAVIDWLHASAAIEQFDVSRLRVIAYSGGGLLIPELVRRSEAHIRGYALLYPLLGRDADESNSAETVAKLRFKDALPLLAERGTPLLIVRGGADEIPQLLPVLDAAIAEALRLDARLELINLPGAPHGFDVLHADDGIRRAIERTIEFVLVQPVREERSETHYSQNGVPAEE